MMKVVEALPQSVEALFQSLSAYMPIPGDKGRVLATWGTDECLIHLVLVCSQFFMEGNSLETLTNLYHFYKLAASILLRDMLTCFGCWLYAIHTSSLIIDLHGLFQSQVPDVSLNRFLFWNCNLKTPVAHRACNNIQKPPSCQKSYPFYFSEHKTVFSFKVA